MVLRPGIVHRIDKDTSGLLMIAKMMKHLALAQELKDRSLFVNIGPSFMEIFQMTGVIEAPIGRSEKDRRNKLL